jgi:hypothetical protein
MSDTSDTAEKRQRCAVLRQDGQPCQALAMHEGPCIAHAPQADVWRAQGGTATRTANRASRFLPSFLRLIVDELVEAIRQVHEGTLEPKRLSAMAAAANAVANLFDIGELEEHMRELEQRMAEYDRQQTRASAVTRWRA